MNDLKIHGKYKNPHNLSMTTEGQRLGGDHLNYSGF